jgi:hypothetical protein
MSAFTKTVMMTIAVAAIGLSGVAEAREGRVKARGQNGVVAAGAGPNGGAYARGRGAVQNDNGSVTSASGAVARGPNGGRGARASTTTVNPDGSATHQGGFVAEGAQGSVASSGSAARNADGTYSGARSTQATSATTGATYKGSTSYDSTTGVTRTATCTDAAGAAIVCPSR